MDKNLEYRIRAAGLPALEIDAAMLAAVAKGDGRVLLLRQGQPIAAVVSLADLGFVLDAEAAEQEDQLRDLDDPPSGSHRVLGH
jgi:hypothetical protein